MFDVVTYKADYLKLLLDLALLKMDEPLTPTKKVKSIQINDFSKDVIGQNATISGWGQTSSQYYPDHLKKGTIKIGSYAWRKRVLLLHSSNGISGCFGDSGGKIS